MTKRKGTKGQTTIYKTLLHCLPCRFLVGYSKNIVGHALLTLPVFSGVCVTQSLFLCVMFCRSLFVLLSLFSWSLCCLSFFDLRTLITPLVSSRFFFPLHLKGWTLKKIINGVEKYTYTFNDISCSKGTDITVRFVTFYFVVDWVITKMLFNTKKCQYSCRIHKLFMSYCKLYCHFKERDISQTRNTNLRSVLMATCV
jgi:hypothetical protein